MLIYQNIHKNTLTHSVGSSLGKDLKRTRPTSTKTTTTTTYPTLDHDNTNFLRELGFAVNGSNKKPRL